ESAHPPASAAVAVLIGRGRRQSLFATSYAPPPYNRPRRGGAAPEALSMRTLSIMVSLISYGLLTGGASAQNSPSAVEQLQSQAQSLRELVDSQPAKDLLSATADLPSIENTRVVHWNGAARKALTAEQAAGLSEEELSSYRRMELGEQFYYFTAFGTPLAYTR